MASERMKHITVCIPFARDFIYNEFMISWTRMFIYAQGRYLLALVTINGPYIDANRDALVQEALKMNTDYVLFLDDDQTYPKETPEILMGYDKDIVGGITPRKETATPMIWDYNDRVEIWNSLGGRKGLVKVDGMGMGGVLIKADVFPKLQYPYFKRDSGQTYNGCGEDIAFYLQCKDAGVEVWADTDLRYGHMAMREVRLGVNPR